VPVWPAGSGLAMAKKIGAQGASSFLAGVGIHVIK
jgi:hypothetical protein